MIILCIICDVLYVYGCGFSVVVFGLCILCYGYDGFLYWDVYGCIWWVVLGVFVLLFCVVVVCIVFLVFVCFIVGVVVVLCWDWVWVCVVVLGVVLLLFEVCDEVVVCWVVRRQWL